MSLEALQIGEVASLSGVSVDSVRYYEKLKLLPKAARSSGGYRIFPAETVDRIKFIKQAQEMGFTLQEIQQLFTADRTSNGCLSVHSLLVKKLSELEEKTRQMKSFKTVLNRHLRSCESELQSHGKEATCPVLVTIEHS